jgi:hypothetical protein
MSGLSWRRSLDGALGVPSCAASPLPLSAPEQANLSQLQAPRDRTVRGVLHPWQPAIQTLAQPSRCHCQVPGALCAVPWGRGHFGSLQSLFLRLFCLQGWLLFSSAHHHHHQHRTRCGSSTFTLFFFSFVLRAQSLSPNSASWFASFFSASFAPLSLCSASILQRLRRAPFPSAFAVFEPSSTCFLFSLFTALGVALYCTHADIPDCIVSVLCIYLSFFLFTCCFFFLSGDWLC